MGLAVGVVTQSPSDGSFAWIRPQLTRNVDEAPAGDDWVHEIKYDGYSLLSTQWIEERR